MLSHRALGLCPLARDGEGWSGHALDRSAADLALGDGHLSGLRLPHKSCRVQEARLQEQHAPGMCMGVHACNMGMGFAGVCTSWGSRSEDEANAPCTACFLPAG